MLFRSERCNTILSQSDPICFLFADRYVPLILRGCIVSCGESSDTLKPHQTFHLVGSFESPLPHRSTGAALTLRSFVARNSHQATDVGPSNERRNCSGSSRSSERRGRRRHQGCNLRRLLASSECFRKFRPRPEKSDPAPQHPRNLRNRMLRHLACHHSGGDGFQPCIMSGLKEPLLLRVAVPDQRLATTAQANRLLEPADFGHDLGFAPRPRPPRSFYPHWCSFANLRLSLNTLRCSRAMFSDGYG